MLISVITPIKDPNHEIVNHCNMVMGQESCSIEHVIIDGSDGPVGEEIIESIEGTGSRYFWKKDDGLYEGLNNGLDIASGDFIHILNFDDRYSGRNILEKVSNRLAPDRINSCAVKTAERGVVGTANFKKWKLLINQSSLPHPGIILSREIISVVGRFDESFKVAGDSDYLLRALREFEVNRIPGVLVEMDSAGLSRRFQKLGYHEYCRALKREYRFPLLCESILWMRLLKYHYAKAR